MIFYRSILAAIGVLVGLNGTGVLAAEIVKANNATALNATGSWVGGVVPTNINVAVWDATVTAARSCAIGTNLTFQGIRVTNVVTGLQTISTTASSALTLGASGIDLSGSTVDMTISAVLSFAAAQTWSVAGGRTLLVSGVNTGSAAITANGPGALRVGNSASLGTGALTLGNSLNIGSDKSTGRVLANAVALGDAISIYNQSTSITIPTLTFSGGLALGSGSSTVTLIANGPTNGSAFVPSVEINSAVTGAGTLIFTNGSISANPIQSILFDSGASVNTRLTLGAGVATLVAAANLFNTSTRLQIDAGGILQLTTSLSTNTYKTLMYNQTLGALNGAGTITSDATTAAPGTLTVDSSVTGVDSSFSGVISNAASAVLGLVKLGANSFSLAGVNLYTGTTEIKTGKLLVNGSTHANSAVTVWAGAVLGGTGTVNGVTTVNGSLEPGDNSIGQLNIANNVTWNGGASASSATDWNFALGAGNAADLLNITGNFTKGTGSAFRFDFGGSTATGTFKVVDWSGSTTFNISDFSYVNLGGGHTATFQFNGSQLEVVVAAYGATSVSQFGITWTFETNHLVGQYANGDWWVVGPVSIIGISPASTNDGTGWIKNGSQLNPPVATTQGYDNSAALAANMAYDALKNAARPGGNDLSAGNPLVITNGSLVSTISKTNNTDPTSGVNRSQLQTAAILTVVDSVQPSGAFRPPPVGNDKTSYWNKSDLDYTILKSLAAVPNAVSNIPPLATVEAYYQRPWLEQNGIFTARYIHPAINQPDYGRDMAHLLAQGLLALHLNYTPAQKETLYIRLVQYGLDIYGAAAAGCVWKENGGHSLGRKMPMILAGLALNDTNILAWANAGSHFIFQEDRQTWYVTQYDVGRVLYTADGRPRDQYIQSDVGIPEWGEKHTDQESRDGRNWDTFYRDINYAGGMGHALAAHLTTGAVAAWNWSAYFDYMDRAFGISGAGASANVDTIQPYVASMWNAYRNLVSSPLVIATISPLAAGTVGVAYSQTLAATGGTTPYSWAVISGGLPAGLVLAAGTGAISGTPTTVTNASFQVVVTDNVGATATNLFNLAVALPPPLAIATSSPLAAGTVGVAYNQTLAATGGTAPYSWTVISGGLPAGLVLAADTGAISGTPTTVTNASFQVVVTDNVGATATNLFNLAVALPPPLVIASGSPLPGGAVGVSYSQTLVASGGVAPYTWAVISGGLPAGLALNAGTGAITGTPTIALTTNFQARVMDNLGTSATNTFSLTIDVAPPLPTVSIAATTGSTTEGSASPAVFTVTRSGSTASNLTVFYILDGSAANGVDYNLLSGSVTISNGVATASIKVTALADVLAEATETVVAALSANAKYLVGSASNATVNILNSAATDYFTEQFTGGTTNSFDMVNKSIAFTPTGGANYTVCLSTNSSLPDVTNGVSLAAVIQDDGSTNIVLTGGKAVYLYGQRYTNFYVNANGNITFGSMDGTYNESLSGHFSLPRIAMLWHDLNPGAQGMVTCTQLTDRVVVTFQNVREYSTANSSTFQCVQYFDGRIVVSWMRVDSKANIIGLSRGTGQPGGFIKSNFSAYSYCQPSVGVISPGMAGGQLVYTVCGLNGQTFVVQISGDLLNWSPLSTNTLTQSCLTLTNLIPLSATNRFYRIKLLP